MRLILVLLLAVAFAAPAGAVTVERVVSPGGIEAWLIEDHSNPIIDMETAFRGGSSAEPAAKAGLAYMTGALLDEGAGPYDSQAFQAKLDDLAIELSFDAGKDMMRGHLKTVTDNRDTAFELVRLAMTQPRFDKDAVERIRSQIQTILARERQSPETVADRAWYAAQFPGHPYGRSARGTPDTIKGLTVQDLRGWQKAHLARDNLIIAVVGDITPEALRPLLDATFGGLPARSAPVMVPEAAPAAPGTVTVIERDNPQSVALLGQPGIKRADPDWYAAYVMNYILGGGGFSSWLTEEVREKRGLAYSTYSYLIPYDHAGLVMAGVATENSRMGQSLDLIRQQWTRMRDEGPDEQTLADAKTYLIGSFPLMLESTTSTADLLVRIQRDNLGIDFLDRRNDFIRAVTLADIRRVAKRLLDPSALAVVVVGKPGQLLSPAPGQ
jgi:zinc protease